MKKVLMILLTGLLVVGGLAFRVVENILSQLEIAEQDAREYIFSNFQEGNLSFPYSTALKKLATGKRSEAVTALGAYIRQYVNSPEFAAQYKQVREAARPQGPGNAAAKISKRLEELKHDIETNEKDMKGASGDMKKLYEGTLQVLRSEEKALKDPKDPQHGMFVANLTGFGNMNMDEAQYKTALKEFEQQYPATVKDLVKMRLKEFLAMTADMSFDAKLINKGGRLYFADPALEAKDGLWKRCFRSGKETMTAARGYAQGWLKELP